VIFLSKRDTLEELHEIRKRFFVFCNCVSFEMQSFYVTQGTLVFLSQLIIFPNKCTEEVKLK
jgi:hypothetical protein